MDSGMFCRCSWQQLSYDAGVTGMRSERNIQGKAKNMHYDLLNWHDKTVGDVHGRNTFSNGFELSDEVLHKANVFITPAEYLETRDEIYQDQFGSEERIVKEKNEKFGHCRNEIICLNEENSDHRCRS
jgi:hypothetical protein